MMSLLFYLLSFSSSALLLYYGMKHRHKLIVGISLAIPIIIGGLRYGVGTDYFNYIKVYESLTSLNLIEFLSLTNSNIELGFYILAQISHFFTDSPIFLFTISSFLTILFFYLGLKRYELKHPVLVYFLFLLTIYPITFNGVRQGIAASICFFAISFLIKQRALPYFLWILAASLFHTSALFLIPLYFIAIFVKRSQNQAFYVYIFKLATLSIAIIILLPQLFNFLDAIPYFEKYNQYQVMEAEGNNYTFYIKLAILGAVIAFSKWLIPRNSILYLYALCFALLETLTLYLGFISDPIKRISLYFSFFSLILMSNFVDIFKDNTGKTVMYIIVIGYGVASFYLYYYILGQADIIPYKLVLGESS